MKTYKTILCTCNHDYQDSIYGQKMRTCNLLSQSKKESVSRFRCTVCSKIHISTDKE